MVLIDTHAHIYLEKFEEDLSEVLKRANEAGVKDIFMPNIDSETIEKMVTLEETYPQCHSMIGLHPCSVNENYDKELTVIEGWLKQKSFAAIGEIGMDLYWDKTFQAHQEDAFRRQCKLAISYDLPIVIHSRESTREVLDILNEFNDSGLKGVFHCFSGTKEEAIETIEKGFYLGIGGVLTFKNSGLDQEIKDISLEHIVLETDAPYLAPVPNRGKRNEPAYVKDVAEYLANLYNVTLDTVAEVTTKNAERLFHKTKLNSCTT